MKIKLSVAITLLLLLAACTQVPVISLKSSDSRPSNRKPWDMSSGSTNFIASPVTTRTASLDRHGKQRPQLDDRAGALSTHQKAEGGVTRSGDARG